MARNISGEPPHKRPNLTITVPSNLGNTSAASGPSGSNVMQELLDLENNLPNELLETPSAGQQWADAWTVDQTDVPSTSTSTDTNPSPINILHPNEEAAFQEQPSAANEITQNSLEQDSLPDEPSDVPHARTSGTGNEGTSTRSMSDPVKQKFAQHHFLLTILHTLKCKPSESSASSSSSTGEPQCPLATCRRMKEVLQHMRTCRTPPICPVQFCSYARWILSHYRSCTAVQTFCPICSPVKYVYRLNAVDSAPSQRLMQVLGQLLTIVGSSNDPVLLSQVHRLVSSHPPLLSAYQKRQSEHSLRQLIARATPPVTPSRMSTRDIVKQALEEASAVVATIDSDDKSPSPRIPTCSICLDRLIETIIFPCRHFFCGICSLTITKCGFCRQTIQSRHRVFF